MSHQNLFRHRTISLRLKMKLPTNCEYSQKWKRSIFNVINLIESERNDWKILLCIVNECLKLMLGISMHWVERLKSKFWQDQERLFEKTKKAHEEELKKWNKQHESTRDAPNPNLVKPKSNSLSGFDWVWLDLDLGLIGFDKTWSEFDRIGPGLTQFDQDLSVFAYIWLDLTRLDLDLSRFVWFDWIWWDTAGFD